MSGSHRRAFSCFGLGKKLLFVISLLVQIFRIYGTGLLCYQQYTRLVIKVIIAITSSKLLAGEICRIYGTDLLCYKQYIRLVINVIIAIASSKSP